jgi:hypothetical protein
MTEVKEIIKKRTRDTGEDQTTLSYNEKVKKLNKMKRRSIIMKKKIM